MAKSNNDKQNPKPEVDEGVNFSNNAHIDMCRQFEMAQQALIALAQKQESQDLVPRESKKEK